MRLSVIMPVYNEENTVAKVIKQVLLQKDVFELIIVNDGSSDNTLTNIEPLLSKRVRVVDFKQNKGKGSAIIAGINEARGEFCLIQDADLECNPKDYTKLIEPLVTQRADFVIGNRWKDYHQFPINRWGALFLTGIFNLLFGTRLSDVYQGFKVGPLNLWRKLKLSSPRFEIEAEIMAKLVLLKARIEEVPVAYQRRSFKAGKKIKPTDAIDGILKMVELKFKLR